MAEFITAQRSAELIPDGATVGIAGMGLSGWAEEVARAMRDRFKETGHPCNINLKQGCAMGDWKTRGVTVLGEAGPGLVTRWSAAHIGSAFTLCKQVQEGKIQCHCLPQGVIVNLWREIAAGRPGLLTKVGLGTFVDPRLEGGRMNEETTDDAAELVQFNGEDYLFYKGFPLDVALLRGTVADEDGNITFDHWEHDIATGQPVWHIAATLMGNGMYSVHVTDPAKFYQVLGAQKAGTDGSGRIAREDIEPQIKTEAIAAIRQGVGQLSKLHIPYTDIAAHEAQLTEDVNALLDKDWGEARGIGIFKIAIGMIDADPSSKEKIEKYQETKGYTDPSMLGAYMGMGQTQAMQAAGANANGAVTGFAGLGMMGGAAQTNIAGLMQQGMQAQQAQAQQAQYNAAAGAVQTPVRPAENSWTCACGSVNTGKFCPECGSPKPEAPSGVCPNCGQAFPDPANPPKFCPECGTKL